jgi:hypothetical protein
VTDRCQPGDLGSIINPGTTPCIEERARAASGVFETSSLTLTELMAGLPASFLVVRRNERCSSCLSSLVEPSRSRVFCLAKFGTFSPFLEEFQGNIGSLMVLGATGLVHGIYSTAKWVVETIFVQEFRQNPLVADRSAIVFMHTCGFRSRLSGTRPEHKRETCDELLSFLGR